MVLEQRQVLSAPREGDEHQQAAENKGRGAATVGATRVG